MICWYCDEIRSHSRSLGTEHRYDPRCPVVTLCVISETWRSGQTVPAHLTHNDTVQFYGEVQTVPAHLTHNDTVLCYRGSNCAGSSVTQWHSAVLLRFKLCWLICHTMTQCCFIEVPSSNCAGSSDIQWHSAVLWRGSNCAGSSVTQWHSAVLLSLQTSRKIKRLKVRTLIYGHLQGNQNSSGLQFKVAYWPALAVGGAA